MAVGATAVAPARAADVVSSNVVGYQRLTIPAGGYALLANPFVEVGSDGETFPINDMFADDVGQSNGGMAASAADQIQPWDSAQQKYKTYYFSSRINKWSSGSPMTAATDAFDPEAGYWYFNKGENQITLTVSGEVAQNEVEVTLVPGYSLVCNPFPVDLPLNSEYIDWKAAGANGGMAASAADQIQPWDSAQQKYKTYYFSSRINKWSEGSPMTATTASIEAGQGFWYFNKGEQDIKITLKSPLAPAQD